MAAVLLRGELTISLASQAGWGATDEGQLQGPELGACRLGLMPHLPPPPHRLRSILPALQLPQKAKGDQESLPKASNHRTTALGGQPGHLTPALTDPESSEFV